MKSTAEAVLFDLTWFCVLRFSVAAEHVDDFVFDNRANSISCGPQILTGVEVRGVEREVLSDGGGDGKTEVAVDVDFADGHACGFAEHFFGNTLCAPGIFPP